MMVTIESTEKPIVAYRRAEPAQIAKKGILKNAKAFAISILNPTPDTLQNASEIHSKFLHDKIALSY